VGYLAGLEYQADEVPGWASVSSWLGVPGWVGVPGWALLPGCVGIPGWVRLPGWVEVFCLIGEPDWIGVYLAGCQVGGGRGVPWVGAGHGLATLQGYPCPAHPLAPALGDHVGEGAGPLVPRLGPAHRSIVPADCTEGQAE
jgi:hypothetical protein